MLQQYDAVPAHRRRDWLDRAVIEGFIATAVMTMVLLAAFAIVVALGSDSPGSPLIFRWLWALAHNVVTEHAQTALPAVVLLHFVFGINWAVLYAAFAEPRLTGPGWRRGLIFAPLPWLLSLLVFLPAAGGGVLGLGLGAGVLPIVGNLVLHLVYGFTLGYLYPPEKDHALVEHGEIESADEARIIAHSVHTLALGLILGLGLGGLLGLIAQATVAPGQSLWVALLLGAAVGSVVGTMLGSFMGLTPQRH